MNRHQPEAADLVKDKIAQAHAALRRESIDLWLVFLQETSVYREPILDYLIGQDVTWQSAFLFTATGEAVALVGNFDVDSFQARGCFTRVVGYTKSVAPPLTNEIRRLRPAKIALNYAADDPTADGLTHGLFLVLQEILSEAGAKDRWISSQPLVRAVRGCKSRDELARIEVAVQRTEAAFDTLCSEGLIGKSERQIAARIAELADRADCGLAFGSIVNAGTKSAVGHTLPTEAQFTTGDLLHIDFGFRYHDYCADLQRCVYALGPGESAPPSAVTRAFGAVADCIQEAYDHLKPGVLGKDIDAAARAFITGRGYPEYQHALGHQLGRAVHDGGALLGPEWPRYGNSPRWPVEVGQVFTLELEAEVPGVGYASLEEDVVVTEAGSRWLSRPQRAPILLGG
jgi:Xaa-Pro aminopeptidase